MLYLVWMNVGNGWMVWKDLGRTHGHRIWPKGKKEERSSRGRGHQTSMRQKVMNSSTMRRNNHYYHHHPHHLYKLPPSLPFAALRPTFLFCIQLMFCCSRSLYQGSCIRSVLCQVVEDKDKTHRSGANGVFRFLFNIISSYCSFPPFSLCLFLPFSTSQSLPSPFPL